MSSAAVTTLTRMIERMAPPLPKVIIAGPSGIAPARVCGVKIPSFAGPLCALGAGACWGGGARPPATLAAAAGSPSVAAAPFAIPRFEPPRFPDRAFDVRSFGAVEGGQVKNTKAVADAIAA